MTPDSPKEALTDAEIDRLLEMEAKATPGEWVYLLRPDCLIQPHVQAESVAGWTYTVAIPLHSNPVTSANMEFIAAARNSIRPLAEEVKRSRARIEECWCKCVQCEHGKHGACARSCNRKPGPVRADPDDEPDLTPEQEAELQAEFDAWKKTRAVRADPVREELLRALFEAIRVACQCAADTAGTPSYEYFDSLAVKWRAIAARAESTAPAHPDPTPEQILKTADDLDRIAAGLRDVVAGRITPMSEIDPDFAVPAQEKTKPELPCWEQTR